jgi:hypothetical protein
MRMKKLKRLWKRKQSKPNKLINKKNLMKKMIYSHIIVIIIMDNILIMDSITEEVEEEEVAEEAAEVVDGKIMNSLDRILNSNKLQTNGLTWLKLIWAEWILLLMKKLTKMVNGVVSAKIDQNGLKLELSSHLNQQRN